MKKVLCVVFAMLCCVAVLAGPPHGGRGNCHGGRGYHPHHWHGGRGYHHHHYYHGGYGYRNDGLALAAGICNIVGGVIRDVRTPVYVAPTPVYTTPAVSYYPPVPVPTTYYVDGRPVGSVDVRTETRQTVVNYNTYLVEQTVSTGGSGTIVISR